MVEANNDAGLEYEDSAEEQEEMTQEERDAGLLDAVKANDYDLAEELLNKQASPTWTKDGWNSLLWAACNGNEDMVRLLIQHNAHSPYINQQQDETQISDKANQSGEEGHNAFAKPEDASKVGKYTPLHWASYKGHYKVVWLLLKAAMSPIKIDMNGNTSVHQVASAGADEEDPETGTNGVYRVLECFMSSGVDVDLKNARGHTPLDLATDEKVRALIIKATKTLTCIGKSCNQSTFDFKNIRYYCESCSNFFCSRDSTRDWVYEDNDSEQKERPVCRCEACLKKIQKSQQELRDAMSTEEFGTLDKVLTRILNEKVDIDVKLKH